MEAGPKPYGPGEPGYVRNRTPLRHLSLIPQAPPRCPVKATKKAPHDGGAEVDREKDKKKPDRVGSNPPHLSQVVSWVAMQA